MSHSYSVLTKTVPKPPTEKKKVIMNLQWQFTGNRNPQYSFKGMGY